MHAIQFQCVEQRNDISSELLDRVRARRGGGLSVTSRVVAQKPELFSKFGSLRLPHRKIGAERIREHQRGCSALTIECVMNAGFSRLKDGHRNYSSSAGILLRLAQPRDGITRLLELCAR